MGWVQTFLILITLLTVSYLLAPKPKLQNPAAAEKFDVPTPQEGQSIPVIFGTVKIKGSNVAWYGDIKSIAIRKKGGKK